MNRVLSSALLGILVFVGCGVATQPSGAPVIPPTLTAGTKQRSDDSQAATPDAVFSAMLQRSTAATGLAPTTA